MYSLCTALLFTPTSIASEIISARGIRHLKVGEFLGLIKLSSHGTKILTEKFEYLLTNHTGTFHNTLSLKKAYITDFIQEFVNSKIVITPIFISGKWCEIDTNQDLERARKIFL